MHLKARKKAENAQGILKHEENIGPDGNRNPPEDVDTIRLPHPISIYPHETKTKWDGP